MPRKLDLSSNLRPYAYLILLTIGALFVHGYHPGIEDAEIYGPGIKKLLNPSLYPFGSEFFLNHARLTFFDELMAASVRISHLSFDLTIFISYLLSTFLTLLACWKLSVECFRKPAGQWAGVALVAGLLTISIAGTSLYIADQYLTPRSIVTFALVFATLCALKDRKAAWALWSIIAICVHPLMALFGVSFTIILWLIKHRHFSLYSTASLAAAIVPIGDVLAGPSHAYQQAVNTRPYFFLLRWEWYEWLGAIAPLFLFYAMARLCKERPSKTIHVMSRAAIVYGVLYLILGLAITIPARFQSAARLQPMRSLHLLYILMFLFAGGLIGEYILQTQLWRWIVLFLPICAVMFSAQRHVFPTSPHIEWPNAVPRNDWLRAFEWIRRYTPADAVFAINPAYMDMDDQHGFRVLAERSRLADALKDSGAVTMFPESPAADHWLEQLTAQRGWEHFTEEDFHRLAKRYNVSWAVLEAPICLTFRCPYTNATVRVCRVE
jgi:hypothetical protein